GGIFEQRKSRFLIRIAEYYIPIFGKRKKQSGADKNNRIPYIPPFKASHDLIKYLIHDFQRRTFVQLKCNTNCNNNDQSGKKYSIVNQPFLLFFIFYSSQ